MGEEPICSQTDMVEAELRRRGVESQCVNRHASSHASSHANSHVRETAYIHGQIRLELYQFRLLNQ